MVFLTKDSINTVYKMMPLQIKLIVKIEVALVYQWILDEPQYSLLN